MSQVLGLGSVLEWDLLDDDGPVLFKIIKIGKENLTLEDTDGKMIRVTHHGIELGLSDGSMKILS